MRQYLRLPRRYCIPDCYHYGMSKQIALRLPDDLVDFLDGLVATGAATSRADVVTRALLRERRRARAEQDVRILIEQGEDADLAAMVAWTSRQSLDLE